jgi:hypothetical protein
MFYMSMVLTEDVEAQRKGIVTIVHAVGQSTEGSFSMEATWKASSLTQALPMRRGCLHLCHDSPFFLPMFSIIEVATGLFSRLRVRTHHGRFFCDNSLGSFL